MNNIDIKIIIRQLLRKKTFTIFNIIGLGIGLGCVMLMAIYLIHEFSFDTYHKNADNLYRVVTDKESATSYVLGETYKNEIPEIENVCRIYYAAWLQFFMEDEVVEEDNLLMADPAILDMLDFDLLSGEKEKLLTSKNSIMLSETMAQKYFRDQNPLGQTFEVKFSAAKIHFNITGVFKDLPSNSSLKANFICSIENVSDGIVDIGYSIGFSEKKTDYNYKNNWDLKQFTNLVQLKNNVDAKQVEKKCTDIYKNNHKESETVNIALQPYTDIYLHSAEYNDSDLFKSNQLQSLKIFMAICILILIVACLNFILISNSDNNLSVIEIACRKVNGAKRSQIIKLALFKSCLVAFLSLIPALIFVKLSLPLFNNLFQNELSFSVLFDIKYIAAILFITLITGLSAGTYLGFYVSGIAPIKLFKTSASSLGGNRKLKGSLVVGQFVAFILLAVCFMFMQKQYNYSLNKDLGLKTDNVLIASFGNGEFSENANFIKNELVQRSNIVSVVPTSFMTPPSDNLITVSYKDKETGKSMEQEVLIFGVGELELLDIPLIEGITFNSENAKNRDNIIINQAAAKKYNVSVGDKISNNFNVIGIVPNFHFHSLHKPVEPVFIVAQTNNFPNLLIKYQDDYQSVVNDLKSVCGKISPGLSFEYQLLNDRVVDFYKKEEKQVGIIAFFSTVALLLSMMGLLGFVAIVLANKTKEIGVRRVNGAKVTEIIAMINFDFLKWVFVACVIAFPIAYYTMDEWLQNFAYRTHLSWWVFASVFGLALLISIATASWKTWKAANRNPIEALRYE